MNTVLIEQLLAGVVTITFVKLSGEQRTMNCTLSELIIPKSEKVTKTTKPRNVDTQVVYDVDKKAWRSFRWNSLI